MHERDQFALLQHDPATFAGTLLASLDLPAHPLIPASGWANAVWLAPGHVVRLSSGRFRDAYAHEIAVLRMLPDAVPHARSVAHGRVGDREWMVLERVPGQPLSQAWSRMTMRQRQGAAEFIGGTLRALHATPLPEGFHNPWLTDALAPGGAIENAYHAPPRCYRQLLEAASHVANADRGFLREVEAFLAARLDAFDGDRAVLVHGDANFANWLWDGERVIALLDYEGARPAAPDLELDTLLRFVREPGQFAPPALAHTLTPQELDAMPEWLIGAYPELFAHPRLAERLAVYDALWQLVQMFHFSPRSPVPDPRTRLHALLTA